MLFICIFLLYFLSSCSIGGIWKDSKQEPENSDSRSEPNIEAIVREAVVVIDPGHGGEDIGTYYKDLYEKDINLDISIRLGDLLKQEGISVVFTREGDTNPGLRERADVANVLDAALFISIHNNQMPGSPNYGGTETLYCPAGLDEPLTFDGKRFASIVQGKLVEALETYDNGIISRPNLAVLRLTKMPAVIAEIGYMSNSSDREKLISPDFRQKAARALCDATLSALDELGAVKGEDGRWTLYEGSMK